VWDPTQYQRYAGERGRPFAELLARVGAGDPALVVDLGCGPGALTETLADRWPAARVVGVDASEAMVAEAKPLEEPGRLEFVHGDLRAWSPPGPVDVLVSNATLQWVPGHLALLADLLAHVVPGGWFAFQVPGNFGEPSHTLLRSLASEDRWRDLVGPERVAWPSSHEPRDYLDALHRLVGPGGSVDVWETTYLHVLPGEDAVLDWVTGTGARPVLTALDEQDREEFLDAYRPALRDAYPRQASGTVLPFRRVFAVVRTPDVGGGS